MLHSDDVWRWVVKGVGGITNMVVAHHEDSGAAGCPQQWLDEIEKHAERLKRVAQEQREKACTPNGTTSA